MTKTIEIPWGAWYESKEEYALDFPDSWDVQAFPMHDAPDITSPESITTAIQHPIGVPPIGTLASGKSNAVIVVEDISRPTKCGPICEAILQELNKAGIPDSSITLIGALGGHRPMSRGDYIQKVGQTIVERVNIENHHPYENLVHVGVSKKGTPIFVNKTYHDAALKVTVSTVVPHPLAGFGGGAKIILPGISGIDTLAANHQAAMRGLGIGLGIITDLRRDIEDVCSRVGLDFSINIVTTTRRGIAGIYAGHYIEAHRKAVEQALQVYHTDLPKVTPKEKFTVGFINAYPEDTEFAQVPHKGMNIIGSSDRIFHRKAAIIFMSASPEGRGYHSLLWETGSKLYQNVGNHPMFKALLANRTVGVFCPNLSRADVRHFYPENTLFSQNFGDLLNMISEQVGPNPKAAVFPTSIQLF